MYVQCGYGYRSDGPVELRPVGETEFVAGVAARPSAAACGRTRLRRHRRPCRHGARRRCHRRAEAHIDAGGGRFRGIRHVSARHEEFNASLLGRPPADLFQRPGFRHGLTRLQALGLSFDAWLYHPQIDQLTDLARALPELPMVLDHVGGPLAVGPYAGRRDASIAEWRKSMQALAECPNVHVKLGGLAMAVVGFDFNEREAPVSSQELADAWRPYMEGSIELFGAKRCMFESNFPVDKAMCSYVVLWNAFKRIAAGASDEDKAWLFGGTADAFYRLGLGLGTEAAA